MQIRKTLHDHSPREITSALDGHAHHGGSVEDQSATRAPNITISGKPFVSNSDGLPT